MIKPTRYWLTNDRRRVLLESLGSDLMWALDRVGWMVTDASMGGRGSRRELRRIRLWLGPLYWEALCLMINDGRSISPDGRIRTVMCRDALALCIELEQERRRWGMA